MAKEDGLARRPINPVAIKAYLKARGHKGVDGRPWGSPFEIKANLCEMHGATQEEYIRAGGKL